MSAAAPIYGFTALTLDGHPQALADYRGRVLLIVNVASRCGFTPQYAGLEALSRRLGPRGLSVLGFPCDQFGHQEPGDAREIREFCSVNYEVSFPLFAKVEVNGPGAHPLYRYLTHARRGLLGTARIKWNFTKFLVDREGTVIARYAPSARPESIEAKVAALL